MGGETPEKPAPFWSRLVERRWLWCLGSLLAIGLLATGVVRLRFDVSNEALFVEGDPVLVRFHELQNTFGSDEVLFCLFEVEDAFDPSTRDTMIALGDRLEALGARPAEPAKGDTPARPAQFSLSESLRSPYHSPVVFQLEGTLETRSLAQAASAGELKTAEQRAVWRERILAYRPFKDLLIDPEGRYVAFLLRLDPELMTPLGRKRVADEIEALMAEKPWSELKGAVVGTPIITTEIAAILGREVLRALGGGLLVAFLALLLLFRNPLAALPPFLVILLSLIGTLGLHGWSGLPLSALSAILLTLVICVGIADAMHLVSAYERRCREGVEPKSACVSALGEIWRPCLWTSATTAAGFLALLTSDLAPIRYLGLFAAVSSLLAYGILLFAAPALLVLWRPTATPIGPKAGVGRGFEFCQRLVTKRAGWIVGLAILAALVAAPGAARLDVNADPFNDLSPDEPLRQRLKFVHDRMGGTVAAEVVIKPLKIPEDNIPPAEILARAAELEEWLRKRDPEVIRAVVGVSSGLLEICQAFDLPLEVPRDPQKAGQLMLLLSGSDADFYGQHVATDGSALRITIRMKLTGSRVYEKLLGDLEQELETRFEGVATTHITGGARLLARSNDYMLKTQRESFLLALLIVSLLIAFSTRDLRLGLLSLVPNILPVTLVLGVMGWCDVPVTVPIALIATVALGIIVDDTIHIIHCVGEELRPGVLLEQALERTFARAGRAILFTTLVLVGSFSVYLSAELANLRVFGVIAAGAFLAALAADLLVLPALLQLTTREGEPDPPLSEGVAKQPEASPPDDACGPR
ncbi:MAG: MMPL family transporter [Planctomycetes bacterium]|nr:MMPL family transporter [Planctomycetota bacterium]